MKTITIDDNHGILDLMRFIMQQIDPKGSHFFADSAEEGIELIRREGIRTVFLDIEMPNLSGEEAAKKLLDQYGMINIIFITGHEEYALMAHRLHCCAFVTKPFGAEDIAEAIQWLRVPEQKENMLKVCCEGHFSLYWNGQPVHFKKERTAELFAYLLYKHGIDVTNGELIGILWGDEPDKQDLLRKYIKDMRDSLAEIGAEDVLNKNRGSISLNINALDVDGDPLLLADQFCWYS
jgi:two-component SAPR family response regulator